MTQLRPDLREVQTKREPEKEKKASILIPVCVAAFAALGPIALIFAVPALFIFLIYKLVTDSKKGKLNGTHPDNQVRDDFGTGNQDWEEDCRNRFDAYDQSRYERPAVDFDQSDDYDEDDEDDYDGEVKTSRSEPHAFGSHIHAVNDDHSRASRLKQLEVLKGAGLYTDEEYRQAKKRIIRETEP